MTRRKFYEIGDVILRSGMRPANPPPAPVSTDRPPSAPQPHDDIDPEDVEWPVLSLDTVRAINFGQGWIPIVPADEVDPDAPTWTIKWTSSGVFCIETPDEGEPCK